MRNTAKRDDQVRLDAEHLLEEAMKQPGVKDALAVNQTYQELLDRADLYGSDGQFVQVISANRSG